MDIKDLRKVFSLDEAALKQLDSEGTATARIAIIGVKDHDGDIMEMGAFTEGQNITILPTHQWHKQPLGKGVIRMAGNDVLVDMKFNLESQAAKEWHSWLKFDLDNGTPIQEWSWGWDWRTLKLRRETIDGEDTRFFEKVDVIEASPVLRGAGSSTATVVTKSRKHTTATSNDLWSRAENEARVKADDPGDVYAAEGSKFLHHFIDEDSRPGDASVKACQLGIMVINGECGGATVPDNQKQAVYDHLANHLKDADVTPAAFKGVNSGRKLADEMSDAMQAAYDLQDRLDDLAGRIKGLQDLRAGNGRDLSARKVAEINDVIDAVKTLHGLDVIIRQDPAVTEQVAKAKLRFLRTAREAEGIN